MRIFNKYAYLSAVALVGAVGFTACSSDDELTAEPNPTFDGESVKTQFAISIPYADNRGTRMSETNTQGQGNNFRGIQDVKLIPLKTAGVDGLDFTSVVNLADITAFDNPTIGNYKIYTDINVPIGTTNFLFYGQADYSTLETPTQKFENGILTSTLPTEKIDDVKFSLNDIIENNNLLGFENQIKEIMKKYGVKKIDRNINSE